MLNMKQLGMPSCERVSQLVSQSNDRPLGLRERIAISFHVAMCRYCSRFMKQLRFMRTAIERDKSGTGE
jgi:hypothetical protein